MSDSTKKEGIKGGIKKYLPYFVDIWQYLLIIVLVHLGSYFYFVR
jgi:hypothetical protein